MESADLLIQLIDEMARTHGRLTPVKASFMAPGDPTGLANLVLTAVVRAVTPPTVPQIGRSLGHPRQTMQRQADWLVEEGLIAWIDNPDHKSSRRLIATERGKAIYNRASIKSRAWAAQVVETLDHRQLADAVATLQAIRTKLEADARALQA